MDEYTNKNCELNYPEGINKSETQVDKVSPLRTHLKTEKSQWVHLNVGGTLFTTSRSTLRIAPDSFLSRLCQEDSELLSLKDEKGAYIIDRDPNYFSPILNYLRHGKLVLDKNISEEGVLEEAEFYNVPSLTKLIEERIEMRESRNRQFETSIRNQNNRNNNIYRLLHCHSNELTNLVTTLSDEWKFEQAINIGSPYSRGNKDESELLCVVSKQVLSENAMG